MPDNVKCPICHGPMQSRVNRSNGQRFWGCTGYPMCKGIRDTDGLSAEERRAERDREPERYDRAQGRDYKEWPPYNYGDD